MSKELLEKVMKTSEEVKVLADLLCKTFNEDNEEIEKAYKE